MSIIDRIKGLLASPKVEAQPSGEKPKVVYVEKDAEDVSEFIRPIFNEIYPQDNKAGKFLTEGMRSWAFIAQNAIADEIASNEIQGWKRTGGNQWEEVDQLAVLDLLENPNPIQTGYDMAWLISMYLLSEGEAPLLLDSDVNPRMMMLLNPQNLKPIFDSKNFVESYKYLKKNNQEEIIPAGKVVFLKKSSLVSPFRGAGNSSYIRQTLDIDNYLEEYLLKFFLNDATPGGVLKTDKILNTDVIKRLKASWRQRFEGMRGKFKFAVLEQGLDWKEIGAKISELQVKETMDIIRDKVLAVYKVPKSVLGITEDVNRANGENSDRVFARRAVKPMMTLITRQYNQFLVPKFTDARNIWLEYENPVQEDEKVKAETFGIYVDKGIMTVNEIRERMDMEPIEEKADPKKEEPKKHINPKMINKIKGLEKKATNNEKKEIGNLFLDLAKEIIETDKKSKPKSEFTQEEKDKFHSDKIAFLDKVEQEFKTKLVSFYDRQEKELLVKIKGIKKKSPNISEEKEIELMIDLATPFITLAIEKESLLSYALLGVQGSLTNQDKAVREFIEERTLKLGKSTSETVSAEIDDIFKRWAQDNGDIADLKSRIRDYYDAAKTRKSEVIARTELSRATSFAQEEVWKDVGADAKKWLTARDEMVCEFCRPMDGKIVNIGRNFWNKNSLLVGEEGGEIKFDFEAIKGPPLHPNCRCDTLPVFGEKTANMAEFKAKNDEKAKINRKWKQKQQLVDNLYSREKELARKEKEIEKNLEDIKKIKDEL